MALHNLRRSIGLAVLLQLGAFVPACGSPPAPPPSVAPTPVVPPAPFPKAQPGRFSVVVANLAGDVDSNRDDIGDAKASIMQGLKELTKLPAASAKAERGIELLQLSRVVVLPATTDPDEGIHRGHEQARAWLSNMNASLLLWGKVEQLGDKRVPVLYMTAAQHRGGGDRFQLPELAIPKELGKVWATCCT